MFCTYCGKEIDATARFCPYCGQAVQTYKSRGARTWVYALSYVPILFWLGLVVEPKTPLGKRTANQGLLLLIAMVAYNIVFDILGEVFSWLFYLFPLSVLMDVLSVAVGIALFVAMIVGIVKGAQGKLFEIPLIGKIHLIDGQDAS